MRSSFQNRCQGFAAKYGLALFFFQCCGCASHLVTEKSVPLTSALLRLDPLRNDPRFKKLVESFREITYAVATDMT